MGEQASLRVLRTVLQFEEASLRKVSAGRTRKHLYESPLLQSKNSFAVRIFFFTKSIRREDSNRLQYEQAYEELSAGRTRTACSTNKHLYEEQASLRVLRTVLQFERKSGVLRTVLQFERKSGVLR